MDENLKENINSLIDYYKNNCQKDINLEVIDNIKEWMEFNLKIMRRDFPKKEDKGEFDIYDERFFNIVLPNFDEYYLK